MKKPTTSRSSAPTAPGVAHPLALPLASWRWSLDLAIGTAALSLELLQAQRAALDGVAPGAMGVAPAGARLTIGEIHQRVAAAGYREISEIEWEGDHYDIEARDADGQAVELQVNGDSGVIEHVEPDD